MRIFHVTCPDCGTRFYADVLLERVGWPARCPRCGRWIEPEVYRAESATPPSAHVGTGLSRDRLYVPEEEA